MKSNSSYKKNEEEWNEKGEEVEEKAKNVILHRPSQKAIWNEWR